MLSLYSKICSIYSITIKFMIRSTIYTRGGNITSNVLQEEETRVLRCATQVIALGLLGPQLCNICSNILPDTHRRWLREQLKLGNKSTKIGWSMRLAKDINEWLNGRNMKIMKCSLFQWLATVVNSQRQ